MARYENRTVDILHGNEFTLLVTEKKNGSLNKKNQKMLRKTKKNHTKGKNTAIPKCSLVAMTGGKTIKSTQTRVLLVNVKKLIY